MLRALEQQRDPLARRQRPGRQPIRQEAIEGGGPPRRRQVPTEERVDPRVGARVVGAELDRARENGDGVVVAPGALVGAGRLGEQRGGPPGIANQHAQARQRPRLAEEIAARARHPSHPGPGLQPIGIERDDAAVGRQRGAELPLSFGVERRLQMKRDAQRASGPAGARAPGIGPGRRPGRGAGDRQIGERRRQRGRMRRLPDGDGDRLRGLGAAQPRARRRPREQRHGLAGHGSVGVREPARDLRQRFGHRLGVPGAHAGHEPQQRQLGLGGGRIAELRFRCRAIGRRPRRPPRR